jgi:hypothetical protein
MQIYKTLAKTDFPKNLENTQFFYTFAAGKSYTTSSHRTPPGSEESKGKLVERCDIRGLPIFY